MTRTTRGLLVLCLVILGAGGCATLSRPDPERRHYMLQANRPQPSQDYSVPTDKVLAVRSFRVTSAYDAKGIVSIRSGGLVEQNFYEQFFLLPGEMISSQVRQWLRDARLFALVSDLGGLKEPDFILEGYVQELSRDYRGGSPQAVLTLQLLLLRPDRSDMDVLLQEDYRQVLDLPNATPQALVVAWNQALEDILRDFESKLRLLLPTLLETSL